MRDHEATHNRHWYARGSYRSYFLRTALMLVWAMFVPATAMAATTTEVALPDDGLLAIAGCGPIRAVDVGTLDYRAKYASKVGADRVGKLDTFHTIPARNEMQKSKPHANTVVGNLDFSLRHSPNHHEALGLLIRYALGGGNLLNYPSVECVLDWARRFAPDDSRVWLYGGNYFWKRNDRMRAKAWYGRALMVEPNSGDAHYNLGLLLVELRDYETAREHARAAYAAGFPLPGLRDKLKRAGYPIESLSQSTPATPP